MLSGFDIRTGAHIVVFRALDGSNAVGLGIGQSQLCKSSNGFIIFVGIPCHIAVGIDGDICLGFIGSKEAGPRAVYLVGISTGNIVAFQIKHLIDLINVFVADAVNGDGTGFTCCKGGSGQGCQNRQSQE